MTRSHIIISGTGRAGTTFLMQLFTHLGLNTGFDLDTMDLHPIARAGLELDIRDENAPYIIKSPSLCEVLEDVLVTSSVRIEHAIIPVRQFEAAAASRAHVQRLTTGSADGEDEVNGGLWGTDEADSQVGVLRLKFTKLIEVLVRHDIPITFLAYPRLISDPDYLYSKLTFLLGEIDLASFRTAVTTIVRPEWMHQFNEDDRFGHRDVQTRNIAEGRGQLTEEVLKRREKHRSVQERDEAIAWLRMQAKEKEKLIHDLDQGIAWLNGKADEKEKVIRERDESIAWLRAKVDEGEEVIRNRDDAIAWLRAQVDEGEEMVRSRDESIAWLRAQVDEGEDMIRSRDEAIAWLRAKLDESENVVRARDEAIASLRAKLDESENVVRAGDRNNGRQTG